MKLFLSSAGPSPEITPAFLKLLNKEPRETQVCFIPTAADPENDKWFVDADRKRLLELGFKIRKIDLKQESKTSLQIKLERGDVIFVEGGNTFYLLKYVRLSGFDKIIRALLDQGKIYFGVSAGSIIAGPSIESANWDIGEKDKNIVSLKDLTGLNLVPYTIFPHTKEPYLKLLEKYSKTVDYPVIALSDKQAILVKNGASQIVGEGKEYIFGSPNLNI